MTLNYCSGIFFKSLSYLHKVVRTNFSADFWTFAIFDCNFAKCVAPPSNKKWELCSAPERAIHSEKNAENRIEIGLQTATQCLFELCTPQTNSAPARRVTKNIPTPCFCTYSRRMLYDLPQTLHGDRARRGHLGAIHFSIQRIVFPTGCTEKFGLIDQRAVSQQ